MGKPTAGEVETALAEAERLREQGLDEHHLAKVLRHLHQRVQALEDVFARARLYLHSGEGAHEHALLVRALDRAEAAMAEPDDEPRDIKPW